MPARKWARARDGSVDRPHKRWSQWDARRWHHMPLKRGLRQVPLGGSKVRLHRPRDWAEGGHDRLWHFSDVERCPTLVRKDLGPQSRPKRTLSGPDQALQFMSTRPNTTLADFSQARDSQITFSVTHGWSAFWRGRPWLAGRRIGETSSDVGSSRFWIGWVTKHGDKCARSTCRD